ncbi:alpha/beta hydrolase-fold protein [Pedobacter cryoconitis]|uniref:alpha/beta hydrolase-fold protein n=1 Tax=Pedobacter cryoconitis TaxID=188932 RepID=UPI001618DA12|nr:alpha/beta hydrolase-fold protein [Pedobacter cryoconitis]MBB5645342.1 putative alpha/beta superfamily hydrolase [Pedobacter cryoconitis]
MKIKNKLRFFFVLILMAGCLIDIAKAQDTVIRKIDYGKLDSLSSNLLNQKRMIEVFLPQDYEPGSDRKYDVLYVLDGGNWNTGLIKETQHFLEATSLMPSTIIVSVLGIDRNKDLSPTHLKGWETSGGADKFLGFLKNELIPYIDKKYPSNGENTLWGHSLGGLFVTYALLNEPQAFKSYIAVDPSLWWDNCYIPKIASSKLPSLSGLGITLFMSSREGEEGKTMKIDTMNTILEKYAPAGLTWKSIVYPNETHNSIRLKSTYDGLKFSYAGLNNKAQFHPMNGIILKDKPIKIWYFNDTTTVHYTLDSTVPTILSEKMGHELTLTKSVRLNSKNFTARARYNELITGDFIGGKILPPVSKQKNLKPGGFNYAYYVGKWEEWPDFKNLKNPVKTGITNGDFNLDELHKKDNIAVVIDGQLETKEEGYYMFILENGEEANLYLDNRLLMRMTDANSQLCTYLVPLTKGFYPLRLESFHKNEGYKLKLSYLTPGNMHTKNGIPIPLNLQYGQN